MRTYLTAFALALLTLPAGAQEEAVLRAARYLSGADSEEEIPADWVERVEAAGTVHVNGDYLRPGVLLSDYQVAAIRDYRSRSGDILSLSELALVDGFSQEAVAALSPFLSFSSGRLPGSVDTVRLKGTALLRGTLSNWGGKAKLSGEGWRCGGAWRKGGGSFYAEASFRRWRALAGDFGTRWGQGLAAWSGFSMENLSTLDAFFKRPTGLSPVWSYAPSNVRRGMALESFVFPLSVSAYAARDGHFGFHTDCYWLGGQMGASLLRNPAGWTVSLDGRYDRHGTDLAGEIALGQRTLAGTISAGGKISPAWKWAAQGRAIPSRFSGRKYGEYALAAGVQHQTASLTLDAALLPIAGVDPGRFQLRCHGNWLRRLKAWQLEVRLTERYRNYEAPRTDLRTDLKYSIGSWSGTLRLETVRCDGWGWLAYWEGGHQSEKTSLWLRLTGFNTDSWAARIYCYERDAAGIFSVPAYSGCGGVGSLTGSCKLCLGRHFTLRGTLRAACQLRKDRKPAYTLNLQLQGDWY